MAEPIKLEQLASSEGETFRQLYAIYAASIAAREQKRESWIAAMVDAPDYRVWVAKAGGLVQGLQHPLRADGRGIRAPRIHGRRTGPAQPWHRRRAVPADDEAGRDARGTPAPRAAGGRLGPGSLQAIARSGRVGSASTGASVASGSRGFATSCRSPARARRPRWTSSSTWRSRSTARRSDPPSEVPRSEVKQWLETIYRDVYHCPPDDPRLAQMVAGLPDPVLLD